jgi:hypothetical protein
MQQQQQQKPDVSERWIQHQRQNNKTTLSCARMHCLDRKVFNSEDELWKHAQLAHPKDVPKDAEERLAFRRKFVTESSQKK